LSVASKAARAIGITDFKRSTRRLVLGNGLYPSADRAKQFGITDEQLRKVFWDGINMDATQLQATDESVRKTLESGKELQISHPNGTDLKMRIAGRKVFASDGVISPEDVKRGGEATIGWLPAGEVYLAPVPGTAEGTLIVDRVFFRTPKFEASRLE